MSKSFFGSYSRRVKFAYISFCLFSIVIICIYLVKNYDSNNVKIALIQLGRVMGGAFAFTFSIGTYLAKQSEEYQPRNMPLFNDYLLLYIAFFAFVTISPFIISSVKVNNDLYIVFSIGCYILSFLCLTFIPFAYEMIRTRYYPSDVFDYLQNAAIRNIEKTSNYTMSWKNIIEITRVCSSIYEYDVDLFSAGIGHLIRILHKGVELYQEREEIYLNNRDIGLNEWVRLLRVRIIWLGQEVVEYPLAFERVIVQVTGLMNYIEVIFTICYSLCDFAHQKGQTESLEKGLYYFVPWCERNDFLEKLQPLLHRINASAQN